MVYRSPTEEIAALVQEACTRETNCFGYGIWTHHITQVVRWGRLLARLCNADEEVVVLAALLHDYAAVKDEALYAEHHIYGPLEAERLLEQFGYPPEKIEAVKHCIATHRASVKAERQSIEAQCLADADAMAHIEQVPSLMRMVYVERGLSIDEGTRWVRAKLERSWNKLSPLAQEMMRDKYEAVQSTLSVAGSDAA
ncbi:MAG TPA: HD domain-containing protein [Spirillospora sp.]|nr:HD domain-containing protein [Spirillospora sp.]